MKKILAFIFIALTVATFTSCTENEILLSQMSATIIPDYDNGGIRYAYNYDEEKKTSVFSFDVRIFPEKYLDDFTIDTGKMRCSVSFCNVLTRSVSNGYNFKINEVTIQQSSCEGERFLHVTATLNEEQLTAICLFDYMVSFEAVGENGEGVSSSYVPIVIELDPEIYETKDALEEISDEDLAYIKEYDKQMQEIIEYYLQYIEGLDFSENDEPELDGDIFNSRSGGTKSMTNWSGESWMSNISNDKLVCKMSIPGSHDTCTENVDGIVRPFAETQWYSIRNQFIRGCRCFDLRPGFGGSSKKLRIWHGPVSCNHDFMEAVGLILDQLNAHPSEFAIVIVNQERDDEYTKYRTSWEEDEVWRKNPGRFVKFRGDLTVGDLRGKILFINRDNFYTGSQYSRVGIYPVGGFTSGWNSGEGYIYTIDKDSPTTRYQKTTMYVQDIDESYDREEIEKKKVAIKSLLDKFAKVPDSELVWCFNHASGYYNDGIRPPICNYPKHAQFVNEEIANYIKNNIAGRPAGIVMMDYAGDDKRNRFLTRYTVNGDKLMNAVIDNNFK